MFKRLAGSGINFLVLVISVAIFACAFFGMIALDNLQRPATIVILTASRDLNIGDIIAQADITEKSVYEDENTALMYIPAEQIADVTGGIVALPIAQGQPIMRNAILSPAGENTRLSAVLARYTQDGALFPLPLDLQKVIAPDITTFLPGDLIGITVVLDTRPQEQKTETPEPLAALGAGPAAPPAIPSPTPSPEQAAANKAIADVLSRSFPPLAKELFPQGVRVIAVQGLPQSAPSGSEAVGAYMDINTRQILVLLVPTESREMLALALQQGEIYVSLLARGSDQPTAGFSYWDLEDWFKRDREQWLRSWQPRLTAP
jgi:hypothetical protein